MNTPAENTRFQILQTLQPAFGHSTDDLLEACAKVERWVTEGDPEVKDLICEIEASLDRPLVLGDMRCLVGRLRYLLNARAARPSASQ